MEERKMGEGMMKAGMDFCSKVMGSSCQPDKEQQGLDEKTRELIAIGAAIGAHCQPCLTYHVEKARELGVEDESIAAAVEIGHQVERGATNAMKKFSAELLQKDCGCGPEGCSETKAQAASCCG